MNLFCPVLKSETFCVSYPREINSETIIKITILGLAIRMRYQFGYTFRNEIPQLTTSGGPVVNALKISGKNLPGMANWLVHTYHI